ncbi:MAG: leucine-rich repeat domain-containing protein [Muribaculaceae bacterium]|nr:leucine-rich repeat domain-containing protein [Muribaculaceae bacterium]
MKQKLLFMLVALASLLPARLLAFEYTYEGVTLRYSVIDEEVKTCMVDGFNHFPRNLVIPDIANDGATDYAVTSIGAYAFDSCRSLTSVVIPNSVITIDKQAFYKCTTLTSVEIGNSVISIGAFAFASCSNLTSVEIPNSVTSIGVSAFDSCSSLTSVEIPNSVTSLGNAAFLDCSGLTSVVIGNSVTEIGPYTFYGCSGLEKSAYPNSLKNPFNTGSIIAYDPEGAIIEEGFVYGPDKSAIYFAPLSLEGEYMIPESVTSIGSSAFSGCIGLTSVVIPNSVTSIGSSAFSGCIYLIKSAYPNSLNNPFYDGIAFAYDPEGAIIEDGFVYGPDKSAVYFAPLSLEGEYTIPESVTSIGEGAFNSCSSLTSVLIPNSVTSIGRMAFYFCWNLNSVVIPNSVTEIGDRAFSFCNGLTSVVIPNSVTEIGDRAFSFCNGLTSVVIPNSVTEISNSAFSDCSSLSSVEIPNSVISIGAYAFDSCSSLTSVVIPNSVITIGRQAFYGCNLDTIIMGYGIDTIGDLAFGGFSASNIYITAQTPPEIGSYTFDDYKGILYLQGQSAVNAYDDDQNWGIFNKQLMTEPTAMEIEGMTSISGNAGDTFQLQAKMTPEDMTLPYIFWRSTNTKIAKVDNNGLVELQEYSSDDMISADEGEENDGTCKIIAESLYFDGPIAEVTVHNTGINSVKTVLDLNDNTIDFSKPYEVYNMSGLKVADSKEGLPNGIYIVRQGKAVVKTVVNEK